MTEPFKKKIFLVIHVSLRANYPPQKSVVKLAIGKATEVRRVYLVRGVTVTECDGSSWVFCIPDEGRNVR